MWAPANSSGLEATGRMDKKLGGVPSYGEVTVISSEHIAVSERQVVALGVGLGDSE